MHLEPWVSPCVLTGCCFSPWELWRVWLVDNVLPMRLQTLSPPSVLSLAPSLGSPCSVWRLPSSILNCICMTLADPLLVLLSSYNCSNIKILVGATVLLSLDFSIPVPHFNVFHLSCYSKGIQNTFWVQVRRETKKMQYHWVQYTAAQGHHISSSFHLLEALRIYK